MTDTEFVPAADPGRLAEAWTASVRSCCALLEQVDSSLYPDMREALFRVVEDGGRAGIEVLLDIHGVPQVRLVAIERGGARRMLGVLSPAAPAVSH